jgi:hypothetical protein
MALTQELTRGTDVHSLAPPLALTQQLTHGTDVHSLAPPLALPQQFTRVAMICSPWRHQWH